MNTRLLTISMILLLSVIIFLQNEFTSSNYYSNALASSPAIEKVPVEKVPVEKKMKPSFVTHSKQTEKNFAIVSMSMPSNIPPNMPTDQPVDINLQFMPVANNTLLQNSSIPFEVKIEQRGQVIYQYTGFTEGQLGVVSPQLLRGPPAFMTINILSMEPSSDESNFPGMADKVMFRLEP